LSESGWDIPPLFSVGRAAASSEDPLPGDVSREFRLTPDGPALRVIQDEVEGILLARVWDSMLSQVSARIVARFLAVNVFGRLGGATLRVRISRESGHDTVTFTGEHDDSSGDTRVLSFRYDELAAALQAGEQGGRLEVNFPAGASPTALISPRLYAYLAARPTQWSPDRALDVAAFAEDLAGQVTGSGAAELVLTRGGGIVSGTMRGHAPGAMAFGSDLVRVLDYQAPNWHGAERSDGETTVRFTVEAEPAYVADRDLTGIILPTRTIDPSRPGDLNDLYADLTMLLLGSHGIVPEDVSADVAAARAFAINQVRRALTAAASPITVVPAITASGLLEITIETAGSSSHLVLRPEGDAFADPDGARTELLFHPDADRAFEMTVLRIDGVERDAVDLLGGHLFTHEWAEDQVLAAQAMLRWFVHTHFDGEIGVLRWRIDGPPGSQRVRIERADAPGSPVAELRQDLDPHGSQEAADLLGDPWLAAHYRDLLIGDVAAQTVPLNVIDLEITEGMDRDDILAMLDTWLSGVLERWQPDLISIRSQIDGALHAAIDQIEQVRPSLLSIALISTADGPVLRFGAVDNTPLYGDQQLSDAAAEWADRVGSVGGRNTFVQSWSDGSIAIGELPLRDAVVPVDLLREAIAAADGEPVSALAHLRPGPEYLEDYEVNRARYWPRFAAERGFTLEEFTAAADERAAELVRDSYICTRMNAGTLEKVLESGEFKAFFDVGASSIRPDQLAQYVVSHQALFGLDADLDPAGRPIYAYLTRDQMGRDLYGGRLNMYGTIVAVFGPSIAERTTVTFGDSLRGADLVDGVPVGTFCADPLTGPTANLFRRNQDPFRTTAPEDIWPYIEGQIHRLIDSAEGPELSPLRVDHVVRFVFLEHSSAYPSKLFDTLDSMGIAYSFEQDPPSRVLTQMSLGMDDDEPAPPSGSNITAAVEWLRDNPGDAALLVRMITIALLLRFRPEAGQSPILCGPAAVIGHLVAAGRNKTAEQVAAEVEQIATELFDPDHGLFDSADGMTAADVIERADGRPYRFDTMHEAWSALQDMGQWLSANGLRADGESLTVLVRPSRGGRLGHTIQLVYRHPENRPPRIDLVDAGVGVRVNDYRPLRGGSAKQVLAILPKAGWPT
ncbi:hypothetical protein, partial [Nocardia alni]|uniref:hypothetical protein n=1 Tax=Nocardia alni TaxID=2815723 RepID=UPI001C236D2A